MSDIVTKCCTLCKQEKPLTDFYGRFARCKPCTLQQHKDKYIPKRPIVPDGYKRCPRCKQDLPSTFEYFYSHKRGKAQKLTTYCKPCHRQKEQERFARPKITPPDEITCYKCNQTKPATYEFFDKKKALINGMDTMCKTCRCAKRRNNYYKNDKARARAQAIGREYQKAHRAEKKRYWVQWYRANKEQQRVYRKAYRQQGHDKDRRRVEVQNRRARKLQAPGTHTKQDIQDQYKRQRGHCYWCNIKLKEGKRAYHVDHIVPLSRGGSNWPDNLVIACHSCNESKNAKLPHEWDGSGGRLL